ncbi:MAG: 4Fe-4S binding protein [Firmicutes bacterium]|nr:4Fe-4S binding protein [Bacillota bacterium]
MKQLLILSGKGGTGKTTVAGAFAALASDKVLADCDVDAADLHLILAPERVETHDFSALPKAKIDPVLCSGGGMCAEVCRFGGAQREAEGKYRIDQFVCEGCRVCVSVCPSGAISLPDRLAGQWFISTTRFGSLVHARLKPGEENSGKLVAQVRKAATELAEKEGKNLIIIDGPPGIGCPVIASLTGVDLVLAVTEPTVAGQHDLERLLKLSRHFNIDLQVVINKWDLAPGASDAIERYADREGTTVIGRIPFDAGLVEATAAGLPSVEGRRGPGAEAIVSLWEKVSHRLGV